MGSLAGAYKSVAMQAAAVATGNGAPVIVTAVDGAYSYIAMQITGITTATITFEGTIDDTNWVALNTTNLGTGVAATEATANGLYGVTVLGLTRVRARVSAWTSGTIYVTGNVVG